MAQQPARWRSFLVLFQEACTLVLKYPEQEGAENLVHIHYFNKMLQCIVRVWWKQNDTTLILKTGSWFFYNLFPYNSGSGADILQIKNSRKEKLQMKEAVEHPWKLSRLCWVLSTSAILAFLCQAVGVSVSELTQAVPTVALQTRLLLSPSTATGPPCS